MYIKVYETSCKCTFFLDYKLPCKHIFKFRSLKGIDLFDGSMIPDRFKKDVYLSSYMVPSRNNVETETETAPCTVNDVQVQTLHKREVKLSQQQKYSKVLSKCQKLATIVSEMSTEKFKECSNQLDTLIEMWNSHKNVWIIEEVQSIAEATNQTEILVDRNIVPDINNIPCNKTELLGKENKIQSIRSENMLISANDFVEETEFTDDITSEIRILGNQASVLEEEIEFLNNTRSDDRMLVNEANELVEEKESANGIPSESKILVNDANKLVKEMDVNDTQSEIRIEDIKMPLKLKQGGRPKGCEVTVIGLKKKRKSTKFSCKPPIRRQEIILQSIFGNKDLVKNILYEKKIIEDKEIPNASKISATILENEIMIEEVEIYFSAKAFKMLKSIINQKRKDCKYFCNICQLRVSENCVRCDSCLCWYHKSCSTLPQLPKTNQLWFCFSCK